MHRFFVSPETIQNTHFTTNDQELVHQLWKVLKMRVGEKIVLLDNTEHEYEAGLTALSKSQIEAKILKKTSKPDVSHERSIHLFVPPLKNPSRWEWMLEKCTEIGVASFTPLITERTEVKELRKLDRLQRIIKEAAEQSGRTKLPEIRQAVEFSVIAKSQSEATATKQSREVNLIATLCSPRDSSTRRDGSVGMEKINVFIGPVGDFTEDELRAAIKAGFHPISLGSQILRTETAAIVSSTLLITLETFHE